MKIPCARWFLREVFSISAPANRDEFDASGAFKVYAQRMGQGARQQSRHVPTKMGCGEDPGELHTWANQPATPDPSKEEIVSSHLLQATAPVV